MAVTISKQAQAEFDDLDPAVQERVVRVFSRLESWPQVSGVKWLTGEWSGVARIRVGDYRVIFHPAGDDVVIDRIAHRREVYD